MVSLQMMGSCPWRNSSPTSLTASSLTSRCRSCITPSTGSRQSKLFQLSCLDVIQLFCFLLLYFLFFSLLPGCKTLIPHFSKEYPQRAYILDDYLKCSVKNANIKKYKHFIRLLTLCVCQFHSLMQIRKTAQDEQCIAPTVQQSIKLVCKRLVIRPQLKATWLHRLIIATSWWHTEGFLSWLIKKKTFTEVDAARKH